MNHLALMKQLIESQLKYVAVQGYSEFLEKRQEATKPFAILVDRQIKFALIQYLHAEPMSAGRDCIQYRVSTGNNFLIYEKGNGLFPERFESALLAHRVIRRNTIHTPDDEPEFYMVLYMMAIHEGQFSGNERRVILQRLKDRVGIIRCRYKEVGYYPNIEGLHL